MTLTKFYLLISAILFLLTSCKQKVNIESELEKDLNKRIYLTPHIYKDSVVFSNNGEIYFFTITNKPYLANKLELGAGFKAFPKISPNGSYMCFVKIIKREAFIFLYNFKTKEIKQLTYLPEFELPLAWSQDSKKIMFSTYHRGMLECIPILYEVDINKGTPYSLELEGSAASSYKDVIYFNNLEINNYRAGYKGGRQNSLWKYTIKTGCEKLTKDKNYSVIWPMVNLKGEIFALSDEKGVWNLCKIHNKNSKVLTNYKKSIYYPSISSDKKDIIYEYNGGLIIYNTLTDLKKVIIPQITNNFSDSLISLNMIKDWQEVILSPNLKTLYFSYYRKIYKGDLTSDSTFTNEEISWNKFVNNNIHSISISNNGKYFSCVRDGHVIIVDLLNRNKIIEIAGDIGEDKKFVWHPFKNNLMWFSKKEGLIYFDIEQRKKILILKNASDENLTNYRWSENGAKILFSLIKNNISKTHITCSDSTGSSKPILNSPFNESYPIFYYNTDDKFFVLLDELDYKRSLVFYNNSNNKIISLFSQKTYCSKIECVKNKLYLISNNLLQYYDLRSNKIIPIKNKIINFELFNNNILACDEYGNLFIINVSNDCIKELKCINSKYTSYNILKFDKYNWMWSKILENIYDKKINIYQNKKIYYEQFIKNTHNITEFNEIVYRLIGDINLSHFSLGPKNPYEFQSGRSSPNDIFGFEFKIDNNTNKYVVKKMYNIDPWGYDEELNKLENFNKIQSGDYIMNVNEKEVSGNDNIEKYISDNMDTLSLVMSSSNSKIYKYIIPTTGIMFNYKNWILENKKKVMEMTDNKVGYIHILQFKESVLDLWNKSLIECNEKNKIIIDLRYCSGGDNETSLIKELITKSYGYTIDNNSFKKDRPKGNNKKLVVLMNSYTRSAGEIFAQAFKSLNLGKVIGTNSAGECLNAERFDYYSSKIFIPTKLYFDNNNNIIENIGVKPDIEINNPPDYLFDSSKDFQLLKAIELLKK